MPQTIDDLTLIRGYVNNIPILGDGKPLLVEDDGAGTIYCGTENGNIRMPNAKDLADMQAQVTNSANVATAANNNSNNAIAIASQALEVEQDVNIRLTSMVLTDSGSPTASATFLGQFYIDTTNVTVYISVKIGTGVNDWKQIS